MTQLFGSTIADYIYTLEQGTAGAGVALFRSLFPNDYYAYNAGALLSVNASEHKLVGFNQWDEVYQLGFWTTSGNFSNNTSGYFSSKNAIKVIPNAEYCFSIQGAASQTIYLAYFDKNGTFLTRITTSMVGGKRVVTIPSNAQYLQFSTEAFYGTTYKNDICINLSSSRNGEYEPYIKRTYSLDSSLTLRGIPKLDANNSIYYDGDTYEPNGTVTRRYGVVDLGTLTWTYVSSATQPYMLTNGIASYIKKPATSSAIANIISSKFKTVTAYSIYTGDSTEGIGVHYTGEVRVVYPNMPTDTAQFKTAMSGVYLIYELETPTTETADPYRELQILDPYGTEEYVVTQQSGVSVPVGHETFYPENLRTKIEGLPWDLSMLAPIENGATASQAYAVGKYFLRNNQFCKAKTAIASGATFTLGTNYETTTVAAELYALAQ